MSSRELPFTPDDAALGSRPSPTGAGAAQRERLSDQLRSVRRWIIFAGVAATAAFSWLAVHQTTSPSAAATGGSSVQSPASLPANAPSQSLFTSGTTSEDGGGSGFSLAPAPAQSTGGGVFNTATS